MSEDLTKINYELTKILMNEKSVKKQYLGFGRVMAQYSLKAVKMILRPESQTKAI